MSVKYLCDMCNKEQTIHTEPLNKLTVIRPIGHGNIIWDKDLCTDCVVILTEFINIQLNKKEGDKE